MNTKYVSLSLIISFLTITPLCNAWGKFSMQRVYSFFGKHTNEAVIEKEYPLAKPGILTVNNTDGDIKITTEWQRNSICLKAIKRTSREEDLDVFSVKAKQAKESNNNRLTLVTACSNKEAKGAVDYELIVPTHVQLSLHTQRGQISVQDVKGQVKASTINGAIDVQNINNTVVAQTKESGPITIECAAGNIKATTHKGDIRISDAGKSILASTQKGNIITACSAVPSNSKIVLNSEQNGAITLALPNEVNAKLCGKTERGRLTSDHYITIKPITTQLNRKTRKELERQVDGVLGKGEADIRLTSRKGNIQIVETQTT